MRLAVAARTMAAMAVAALAVAACGDIPQPFRHDEGVPRLALPKMPRAVTVRLPDASEQARAMAEALVRALEDQEVAAQIHDGPAFGHIIEGELRDADGTVSVRWTLTAPDGTQVATTVHSAPRALMDQNNPVLMKRTAVNAAVTLAGPLADPDALPVTVAAAPAATRPDTRPTVTVVPLRGLPGDGDRALTEAIRRALGRGGLLVKDDGADYMVEGKVTVVSGPSQDVVTVAWVVKRGDGAELGNVAQDGGVPRGRLSQSWGPLARDIAEGGAAGVAQVVLADTNGTGVKRRQP